MLQAQATDSKISRGLVASPVRYSRMLGNDIVENRTVARHGR